MSNVGREALVGWTHTSEQGGGVRAGGCTQRGEGGEAGRGWGLDSRERAWGGEGGGGGVGLDSRERAGGWGGLDSSMGGSGRGGVLTRVSRGGGG